MKFTCHRIVAAMLLLGGLKHAALAGSGAVSGDTFRIGVSLGSLGPVNRNDASASLKAWAATVTKERHLSNQVQVSVFDSAVSLSSAMKLGQVHAASMTTEELIQTDAQPESVYLMAKENGWGEHYVVAVQNDGAARSLASLRGRSMDHHRSLATSAAIPWLNSALAAEGLAPANILLRELIEQEKPFKAVLRVFFGQTDACLVTSNAFAISCELNPQIRSKVKILACSPKIVPSILFFRNNWRSALREELETAILDLHKTPSGRQVLTIFQSSRMEKQPFSCLETTLALFASRPGPAEARSAEGGGFP